MIQQSIGHGCQQPLQQVQNPPNHFKCYNNWSYCFTHSFNIKNCHNNTTYQNPYWNHNYIASKKNRIGGQ